jgi:hypothetical protein
MRMRMRMRKDVAGDRRRRRMQDGVYKIMPLNGSHAAPKIIRKATSWRLATGRNKAHAQTEN